MSHVTKLLRRIKAATEPFEGIIGDKRAFIKAPNGVWGNKVLINEFICLKLAQKLRLPIPNGGICIIDDNTNIDNIIDEIDYDENINGVCFFSERIEKSNPIVNSLKVIENIVNKSDINKIALFDHIIYNEDRHEGNILIQHSTNFGSFTMYIIDHSHVFNLKHNWNKEKLENLIEENDFKDTKIMMLNNDTLYKNFFELGILDEDLLKEESEIFKSIINENLLDDIISQIPNEWISNYDDIIALKKYILYRVSNIDYMVQIILSYKVGGV